MERILRLLFCMAVFMFVILILSWKTPTNMKSVSGTLQKSVHIQSSGSMDIAPIQSVDATLIRPRDIPNPRVKGLSCAKLFKSDTWEMTKAQVLNKRIRTPRITDQEYIDLTQNCPEFLRRRQYIMQPISQEESQFPIAFSILIYKDVEQAERLLRAIYRPQNIYCFHVDLKAKESVKKAMHGIVSCFPNVILSGNEVSVRRFQYSLLEAQIISMEALWRFSSKWRYFINLTGQEFPLKTNLDLVRILQIYNGANDSPAELNLLMERYADRNGERVPPPPPGIQVTKGPVHIAVSRGFVDYALHRNVSKQFLEWLKLTFTPDETFFASLNHSPILQVPGSPTGDLHWEAPSQTRYLVWREDHRRTCHGKWVHGLCIFGNGDLPVLRNRPEMFVNKLHLDYQPTVLDCLEELHFNRTRDDLVPSKPFNKDFYAGLSYVKDHF